MQSVNDQYFMFEEIETDAVISLDEDSQLVLDEVSCVRHSDIFKPASAEAICFWVVRPFVRPYVRP